MVELCNELPLELENEWNGLWSDVGNASYQQSFAYCKISAQVFKEEVGGDILTVVVRNDGKLSLVWSFTVRKKHNVTLLEPLGPFSDGYCEPLVRSENYRTNISDALNIVFARAGCDILRLRNLKSQSSIYRDFISERNHKVFSDNGEVFVNWSGVPFLDWDSYAGALRADHRLEVARKRRQLSKLGNLTFNVIDKCEEFPQLIEILYKEKRKWAAKARVSGMGLSEAYESFTVALFGETGPVEYVVQTLELDKQVIALKLAVVGPEWVEWIQASHVESMGKYSPGMVLNHIALKWALENKLNCNLGNGLQDYKLVLSHNSFHQTLDVAVPLSRLGGTAIVAFRTFEHFQPVLRRIKRIVKSTKNREHK